MQQPSLFDDGDESARAPALPALGVPGSQTVLGKEQRLFNRLIGRIQAQRELLQQWRDFELAYHQRVAAEMSPLVERLREARIAMLRVLDRAMADKALGVSQRAKVRDILLGQLSEVLGQGEDVELVRLHDKYSDLSFEERQTDDAEFAVAMAETMFGIEIDAENRPATPEALAQLVEEKVEAAQMRAQQARQTRQARQGRKKTAKASAQEALREHAALGATRALREVYRKLVSELHPDREADDSERVRKTALMQRVNEAYAAGDLLLLLELQLSLEQIDAKALASMAVDRLVHYNRVLDEQLKRLQEELADVTAPFAMSLQGRLPRQLTPDAVSQALSDDIRELQAMLSSIDADRVAFQDIKVLKSRLRDYRIDDGGDDIDMIASVLLAEMRPPRRRRRRGR